MAWVTEYDLGWSSTRETGNIYIQRDGGSYLGTLPLVRDSLSINTSLPSMEDRIVRQNVTFNIINNFSDFYTVLPLMTISNGQLRVEVTRDSGSTPEILFQGFLNCEAMTQDMLHYSDLQFTASGLLNKLQYVNLSATEVLEQMSLIDCMLLCLVETGVSLPINVLCSLYELNHALSSGQTVFNRTSFFTEITWKDNVDRLSALEILDIIMKSFNCYLYWYNEAWYIEHYEDLGDAISAPYQKSYVQYAIPSSYTYASTGSVVVETIGQPYNIHTPDIRPQVGGSQKLTIMPGLAEVEVRCDQKLFHSLINGDLSGAEVTTSSFPLALWRHWLYWDNSASVLWAQANLGTRWRNMGNCIDRQGFDVSVGGFYANGLTTGFFLSVNADTQITFRWLYGIYDDTSLPGTSEYPAYTCTFNYWMYVYNVDTAVGSHMVWNETTLLWESVTGGVPAVCLNTVQINGTDLDPDLWTAEVSVTINLGEALVDSSGSVTDNLFCQFGLGTETWDDEIITPEPPGQAWFGDFTATVSETPDDNVFKGNQNVDFLDKKTVEIQLFDAGWSYRNTLITGTLYNMRAKEWTYDGVNTDSLPRWLLTSYFRLYNVARQKIKMDTVHNPGLTGTDPPQFRPMQIWLDNKQADKTFLLTEDTYYPDQDMHSITLTEYDNQTEINLI